MDVSGTKTVGIILNLNKLKKFSKLLTFPIDQYGVLVTGERYRKTVFMRNFVDRT